MWIIVLIIMGLIAFFIYKSKTNTDKSSPLDVEKGVDEALHQGGMADTILTERDKDQMYICMAMISLKTGFTSARQMKNFVKLNITDYNILALILSSFFLMQLYLYMDSILEERVQVKFPKELADEIQTQIVLGRELIIRLYEKLGYEEPKIKKITNGSVLTYSKLKTPQNELLMQSLLNYHELYTNHKMGLNDNISIGLFSLTTYTTMVPGYLSSMSRMIEHFYGYTLPIVDKLKAS